MGQGTGIEAVEAKKVELAADNVADPFFEPGEDPWASWGKTSGSGKAAGSGSVNRLIARYNAWATVPTAQVAAAPNAIEVDVNKGITNPTRIDQLRDEVRQHKESLTQQFESRVAMFEAPAGGQGISADQVTEAVKAAADSFKADFASFEGRLEQRIAAQDAAFAAAATGGSTAAASSGADAGVHAAIAQPTTTTNSGFGQLKADIDASTLAGD